MFTRYTRRYLGEAPLFAAIVRPVECELIARAGIVEPCLDLGCGDGMFASIVSGKPFAVGIDPRKASVRMAARRKAHQALVVGAGNHLPLRSGSFAIVLCNSVIEHIPPIDETLGECHRVLRRSGRLLITTPSHRFAEYLMMPRLLRRLSLPGPAASYERWFNGHSAHFHTDSIERWTDRLHHAGFEITQSMYYLTPAAHGVFDLFHYLSVPRWAFHAVSGRWALASGSPLQRLWERVIAGLHAGALETKEGPYLFIDARRMG
jgi:ubiquinone/menaquinone biosynthesis C-methylase UbiE